MKETGSEVDSAPLKEPLDGLLSEKKYEEALRLLKSSTQDPKHLHVLSYAVVAKVLHKFQSKARSIRNSLSHQK